MFSILIQLQNELLVLCPTCFSCQFSSCFDWYWYVRCAITMIVYCWSGPMWSEGHRPFSVWINHHIWTSPLTLSDATRQKSRTDLRSAYSHISQAACWRRLRKAGDHLSIERNVLVFGWWGTFFYPEFVFPPGMHVVGQLLHRFEE